MTVGLATEFLSKEQALKYYGINGPSGYSDIIPDFHRSRLVLPWQLVSLMTCILKMGSRRLD